MHILTKQSPTVAKLDQNINEKWMQPSSEQSFESFLLDISVMQKYNNQSISIWCERVKDSIICTFISMVSGSFIINCLVLCVFAAAKRNNFSLYYRERHKYNAFHGINQFMRIKRKSKRHEKDWRSETLFVDSNNSKERKNAKKKLYENALVNE